MIDSETKRKTIMEKVLGASGAVVASQPSFPAHQAPVRREIHGASFETDLKIEIGEASVSARLIRGSLA